MLAILIRVISSGTHTAGRILILVTPSALFFFSVGWEDKRSGRLQSIVWRRTYKSFPLHTTIPVPAQQTIVKEQLQTASAESPTERVAAMSPSTSGPPLIGIILPVNLPFTGTNIPGPTTRVTISVTLP